MHLDRPAGRERHERNPVRAVDHEARTGALTVEDSLEQVHADAVGGMQHRTGPGGHERVTVNLAVWVVKSHTDRLAAVLEREDLLHALHRRQRRGALRPSLDDSAHPTNSLAA